MAVIWADTFNTYGTNPAFLLDGLYAQYANIGLTADPDPNATGNVLHVAVNAANGYKLRRVLNGTKTTAGFSFRLWMTGLPPNNTTIPSFAFLDGSSTQMMSLNVDTVGRIYVATGSGAGPVLATTLAPVLTANAWNHIEIKATASLTVGSFEIRVNGSPVLTGSGNTGASFFQFCIVNPFSAGATLDYYVKDLIAWDTTGSFNNDFLGSCLVTDRLTNSDVSLTWTPSTGVTGYNLLATVPPNDGVNYLSAGSPPPAASLFGLSALPTDVSSVRAMIVKYRVSKVDGGDGAFQAGMKSGASTGLGANRNITTAFTFYEDLFETDPATGSAWTVLAAQNAQVQINRTT